MTSDTMIHPAERAARAAMAAVTAGDRAAWLAAYADDAVLHDPVGGSPLDPEGKGLRGRASLEQFWDLTIAPNDVGFTIAAVHPSGSEAAVVASVSIAFAQGPHVAYDGVFVYALDADERISTVRSYFDLDAVLASLR
jgi:steroid Delta-isomerase